MQCLFALAQSESADVDSPASQLQRYLQDMLRVLTVATEMTGDAERAVFLLRNEPLKSFGYKTADTLVQEGRTDAVIAYPESLAGGAAG